MIRPTFLALMFVSYLATAAAGQETKSITEAERVIAIFTNDWGLGASKGPQLIVSVWGDGLIVWSEDQTNGGAPFSTAKITPEDVSAAIKRITDIGAFDVPHLKQAHFGPDSKFTTILVRTDGNELKMDSWHELSESNGKAVAASYGVTGLKGRKLLQVLAEQPADYLHYRMTWLEIRLAVANLIPKSGKDIDGVATMRRGRLSWNPNGNK